MQATQKYIRTSARKLRLVADAVRSLDVDQALSYLKFMSKRAGLPVYKVVKSAATGAKNDKGLEPKDLVFEKIDVGEGPTLKRWHAVSRGSAHGIMKRTAHIMVVLKEKNKGNNGSKS